MNCSRSAFALSLISAFAIFAPFSAVAEESDLPDAMQIEAVSSTWPVGDAPLVPPIPPATLQRLDMDTAVQLAQERNPIIQEKYQSFRASQDELGSDFATWWPTISFDFNFGNYNQNSYYNYAGANSGIDTSIYSDYTGGSTSLSDLPSYLFARDYTSSYLQGVQTLDVNWKLYDPARGPQIWKGKYLVKEAGSDYIIARRDYSLMTRQAYVKLQRTLASIVTGRQLVDNDRLLLQLADSRKRLGVASQLDVAKQITVLRTDEVNLVNAKRDSLVAQAELAQLLNDPRSMEIQPSEALSPLGSWASSLQETIDSALEYRQVIVKNLSRVKQNELQAEIDLAIYRPTIELVNSLYWTKNLGYPNSGEPYIVDTGRSDLWNSESVLQITLTGFDGGRARMDAAAARKRAAAAQLAARQSINSVIEEVREYFAQSTDGREAVLVASGRVQAASSALKLQSQRFNAGYGTITDVVQSQQDLTEAVSSYIEQLADYNLALVNLARASGLSYQNDPDLLAQVGDPLAAVGLSSVLQRAQSDSDD